MYFSDLRNRMFDGLKSRYPFFLLYRLPFSIFC